MLRAANQSDHHQDSLFLRYSSCRVSFPAHTHLPHWWTEFITEHMTFRATEEDGPCPGHYPTPTPRTTLSLRRHCAEDSGLILLDSQWGTIQHLTGQGTPLILQVNLHATVACRTLR